MNIENTSSVNTAEVEAKKAISDSTLEEFFKNHPEGEQEAHRLFEEIENIEGDTWEERYEKIKKFIKLNIHNYVTGVAFVIATVVYQFKPEGKEAKARAKNAEIFFNKHIDWRSTDDK